MKVTVVENSPVERTLEVSVEPEQVESAYQKVLRGAMKDLRLPGFRKGKVPPKMAERYLTFESLRGQVLEEVLPQAYLAALEQEKVRPLSDPRWEILEQERGKELVFKVTFEVMPTLEVRDYKGVEVTQVRPEVTDQDLERQILHLRTRHAQMVPVEEDRGLQEGDVALVDFKATTDGRTVDRGSAENYLMEMVPDNYLPGFLDNLYGMKPGEEREFDAQFPDDYPGELAGHEVHFWFHLREIKQRQLPAADDEFARDISDCQTMEELRGRLRADMQAYLDRRAHDQAAEKILRKLLDQVPDEAVPPSYRAYRAQLLVREVASELRQMGKTLQDYLKSQGMSEDDWARQALRAGHYHARMDMLVSAIAHQEGITVEDEELVPHLEEEAARRGISAAALRRQAEEEGSLEVLKSQIQRHKVMRFLVEQGKVTYVLPGQGEEVEATYEEPSEAPTAESEKAPEGAASGGES
jgi:trigger factor